MEISHKPDLYVNSKKGKRRGILRIRQKTPLVESGFLNEKRS